VRLPGTPSLTLGIFLLMPLASLYGASVHGTVKNGTTGKPAANVEVILIQLQGGMQPVLNSKTDAEGQFTFDYPAIGTQPMLVRAVYRGINFHQALPPGRNELEVDVFEPSRDPKTISVGTHFVIFQPSGATLEVGEEYAIKNDSQPAQFRDCASRRCELETDRRPGPLGHARRAGAHRSRQE
jgi:hypothetical protein